MAATEVKVPDIGDFKDIPVIELLVKPGDAVKKDDSLLVLESDKATMEVPAPAAGVIAELKVKVGDKVSAGTLVALLEGRRRARGDQRKRPGRRRRAGARGGRRRPRPLPAPHEGAGAGAGRRTRRRSAVVGGRRQVPLAHASPGVRRFARELGVPLAEVTGSGPEGPHPQGGHPVLREAGAVHAAAPSARGGGLRRSWVCRRGPRSTSPSSARSRRWPARASRRSRRPGWRATG